MNRELISLNDAINYLFWGVKNARINLEDCDNVNIKWYATVVISIIRIKILHLNDSCILSSPFKIYWCEVNNKFICEYKESKVVLSGSFFDYVAEMIDLKTEVYLNPEFWKEFYGQAKEKLVEE